MKPLCSILVSILLMFSLTACSSQNQPTEEPTASEPPVSSSEESQPAGESAETLDPAETSEPSETPSESVEPIEEGETLVAYFSWSGNTRQMAEIIAQETGADLFEITTVTPYTDDYDALLDLAQQEQGDDARPELDAQVENWDSYDTIFLGYPNWWSDAPMAVYTFLESYDFTGKTLIPFNTSASGGFGRSLTGISECASGATILDGLALTEGELEDVQNQVTTWLSGLRQNG